MYIPTIIEASFNPQPKKSWLLKSPEVVPGPFAAPGSSGPNLPPPGPKPCEAKGSCETGEFTMENRQENPVNMGIKTNKNEGSEVHHPKIRIWWTTKLVLKRKTTFVVIKHGEMTKRKLGIEPTKMWHWSLNIINIIEHILRILSQFSHEDMKQRTWDQLAVSARRRVSQVRIPSDQPSPRRLLGEGWNKALCSLRWCIQSNDISETLHILRLYIYMHAYMHVFIQYIDVNTCINWQHKSPCSMPQPYIHCCFTLESLGRRTMRPKRVPSSVASGKM